MSTTIHDRVVAALNQRVGNRVDLSISDVGKRTSGLNLVVRYAKNCGEPTRTEVSAFVTNKFGGQLIPSDMVSYKTDSDRYGAVLVSANLHRQSADAQMLNINPGDWRPLDATKTRFFHAVTAKVWHMEEDANGQKMLYRDAADDLEKIIQVARAAQVEAAGSCSPITFESLGVHASANLYDVGDTIAYYCNGTRCRGTIRGFANPNGSSMVHVESESGGTDVISTSHIIDVVVRGEQGVTESKNQVRDHFAKIYPAEFAAKIAR